MTIRVSTMAVKQFPEELDPKSVRLFLQELQGSMSIDRPCIVLDCSKVRNMDRCAIYLLLCCLEEVIKRNGDVKLTAVSAAARATLELTGVGRLFEVYDTNADVLSSLHMLPEDAVANLTVAGTSKRTREIAA